MRWIYKLVPPLLVLMLLDWFWSGSEFQWSTPVCVNCGQHSPAVQVRCEDQESSLTQPESIEDAAFRDAMVRQSVALMDAGRPVETARLIEQLERNQCRLELPRTVPPVYDRPELFRRVRDSIVVVGGIYKCDKCVRWHASTASGFVLSSSGAIVTNHHVIESAEDRFLVIMTADQRVFPVLQVLAASEKNDLAILQVDAEGLQPLPLAPSNAPAAVGSPVNVISHPDGRYYCLTSGIISRYANRRGGSEQVYITADYARGSSGAPVLNDQGQVVAIVSSTDSVYYSESESRQQNLQMVFKSCIPAPCLWRLIRPIDDVAVTGSVD